MNWLDGLIITSLIFFGLEGFKRSFINEALNFLSFLLALFLSLSFFNYSTQIIQGLTKLPHSIDNILGFMAIWVLVEIFFFSLIRLFFRPCALTVKIVRRLAHFSFIPSSLRGLVFISLILVIIGTFPIQPSLKQAVYQSPIGSGILRQTTHLEMPLKNIFGEFASDSLTFLTVKPETKESIDLGIDT